MARAFSAGGDIYPDDVALGPSNDCRLYGGAINHLWSDVAVLGYANASSTSLKIHWLVDQVFEELDITTVWANADGVESVVIKGSFVYVLMVDTGTAPDTHRVYRFAKQNLAGGGTLMTISGSFVIVTTNSTLRLTCDGTSFYINFKAGNTANDYDIAKYSLSGTTLTYVSTTACGSTAGRLAAFHVRSNGQYIGTNSTNVYRYNTAGTLQTTSPTYSTTNRGDVFQYLNDFQLFFFFSSTTVDGSNTLVSVLVRAPLT
jgi:hypothetical protein